MILSQLKTLISEKYGWNEFQELLELRGCESCETKFKKVTGLEFKFIKADRSDSGNHDSFAWIFQIDEKIYQINGYYSSYEGSEMDDPRDFYEVHPVEKTITVYEKVKKQ